MVAIIGSNGQLGEELCKACGALGIGHYALTHSNIRVEDVTSVNNCLSDVTCRPDVVINTAAFHNVDECEKNGLRAWMVNAMGAANVADWCRFNGAKYVYVSTDYCNAEPTDQSGLPLNVYAKTKLAGELAALSICPDALVFRVGTMYGQAGCSGKVGRGNFVDTVVAKIQKQEPFSLPDYTSVLTTHAHDAALRILNNLNKCGVWYGTDTDGPRSHYRIGCQLCDILKLPNKIQAVSFDPNDTIRPRKTAFPAGIMPQLNTNMKSEYYELDGTTYYTPLERYCREKGYINE